MHARPIEPLDQRRQLCRRQPHHPILDPRPAEPAFLEIDAARVAWDGGERAFLNVAGTGFDSEVNDAANRMRSRVPGTAKYVAAVFKTSITNGITGTFSILPSGDPSIGPITMSVARKTFVPVTELHPAQGLVTAAQQG